jgi:hypothetical protein
VDVIQAFERIKQANWVDEDGEELDVQFLPGLSEEALDQMESRIGAPLPSDYRRLAAMCGVIDGAGIEIDFSGSDGFWVEEILPHGLPFAHDGCGNYWVVDCRSQREEFACIFYACHDAPVVVFQGTGMASFIDALPAFDRGERESAIWQVWDQSVWRIWETSPGVISQQEALASTDPAIRTFAIDLDEPCQISDLRGARPGDGFPWGRYGPNTRLRRFGEERIFAFAPPKKQSLRDRLFR